MSRRKLQPVEDSNVKQVTWSGLDFRKVWQIFPKARREGSLDAAFKEGTNVFAYPDAYGTSAFAFICDDGNLRSHGAQNLLLSTVDALQAAGAMFR
jgi:hypothetical protein